MAKYSKLQSGCITPSVQNCLNCEKERCDCILLHMTDDEKEALKVADMFGITSLPSRIKRLKKELEAAK